MPRQKIWINNLAYWVAIGFGVGRAPVAPGTFGTLLGVLLYLLLSSLSAVVYGLLVAALFVGGAWICDIAEKQLGSHDHRSIVWDEVVGYLIAMWSAPSGWIWIVIGFGLFRLFDIWKPFPIRRIDRAVPGGFGCMADDALAGVYAFVMMQILAQFLAVPLA